MKHKEEEGNGEDSSEVVTRRKVKGNQNESKKTKSKGSLRRRMQSILTSPVHLFRRFVLRKPKRPKRLSKKDKGDCEFGNDVTRQAVDAAKQRKLPCYLLFLGLQQSGKSTTISKLFNGKRPTLNDSVYDRSIKVYKNASVGQDIGLTVVDTPGFSGSELNDAELVSSLSSFLNRDLPQRIPTVTFIVARLDESDGDDDGNFEEESSRFCRMLKILSQAKNLITDQQYSNVVLLLTHSQKATDVPGRIIKYQKDFAKVFPVRNPVHVVAIENIRYSKNLEEKLQSYHDIIFEGLKDFAGKRQEHSLDALMNWLTGKAKRFYIPFQQEILPLDSLTECKETEEATLTEDIRIPQDFQPYFVMHHMESDKKRKSQRKDKGTNSQKQEILTCIQPGSQITLADKSVINIEKCLVGDKVLGLHSSPSVITGIRMASADEIVLKEGKQIGNIYCSQISNGTVGEGEEDEKVTGSFIYMYTNNMFELVDASKANVPEKMSQERLYFLDLDWENGTFVMNGFPCFAKVNNGCIINGTT